MRIAAASAILVAGLGISGCSGAGQEIIPSGVLTPEQTPEARQMLALHNTKRRAHCAPELTWSSELAAAAQAWADRCKLAHAPRSVNPRQGENLARGMGSMGTAAYLFGGWYDEVRQYDFGKPRFQKGTGHFTQIVWRGSRRLGCAVAKCGDRRLWVCRYAPMGNITNAGYFKKNVLPAGCGARAGTAPGR